MFEIREALQVKFQLELFDGKRLRKIPYCPFNYGRGSKITIILTILTTLFWLKWRQNDPPRLEKKNLIFLDFNINSESLYEGMNIKVLQA